MAVEQEPRDSIPSVLPFERLAERFSGSDRQYFLGELERRDQMTPEEFAEQKLQREESTLLNLENLIASGSAENFLANNPIANPQKHPDSNSPQRY